MALKTPCDFAKVRYVEIGLLRKTWSWLLFVIGASLGIFMILAILLFIRLSWLPGAITLLGTIVTGPAMKWINDQKSAAVKEDKEAFADLERTCGPAFHSLPAEPPTGPTGPVFGFTPLAGVADLISNEFGETAMAPWYQEVQVARQSAGAAKSYLAALRGDS
ncbi:MAG: hypothetical protein ACLQHF_04990 [Terracidiphilus sp.]